MKNRHLFLDAKKEVHAKYPQRGRKPEKLTQHKVDPLQHQNRNLTGQQ